MISTQLVILLLVVAGLAFFAGYQLGRQSQSDGSDSERDSASTSRTRAEPTGDNVSPLPGPRSIDAPREPLRPRAAPPPASAGGGGSGGQQQADARPEPKRTSAPPPARAGLLDLGSNGKK